MDFFKIATKDTRGGMVEVYPEFVVGRTKDLMVRGRSFYAVWDDEAGLWSTDEYHVATLVDRELHAYAEKLGVPVIIKDMRSFSTRSWKQFKELCASISDNNKPLDQSFTWANTEVKRTDYASKRLPYALEEGDYSAWDELVGGLYSVDERTKIEWAIGALVAGDAKHIQKFLVLYGSAGTGKSTILNIIQKMFAGYWTSFDAGALANANKDFATEAFSGNPLIAIQHDGDLSKLTDNTKLNSIIAHEEMRMNEKYKAGYTAKVNAFLFMGTNSEVKISDRNSGLIRRLIDVEPTGVTFKPNHYNTLMSRIDFELGAIAWHCREVYWTRGKNYYEDYVPTRMLFKTNVFFNFVEANFDVFKSQDGTTLKQAYALYKEYCAESNITRVMPQHQVREELRGYFHSHHDRKMIDGVLKSSYFEGFKAAGLFKSPKKDDGVFSLVLDQSESLFDAEGALYPAQYATDEGLPAKKWANVKTRLSDLDTHQVHYVQVPYNHIVIDFDLKGPRGGKDLERNLEAASSWPPTYAELSKGEAGVHLHYIYDGDVDQLNNLYSDGIEVKVFSGNASLRRKLTKCNNIPIATINSGLPLKEKKMLPDKLIKSERGLREQIARNLRKEVHPSTKSSVDFIKKILDDAYDSGLVYDVSDLRPKIMAFANNSSNRAMECLKTFQAMKFKSEESGEPLEPDDIHHAPDSPLAFFDVEVYPNLFVVCWKFEDGDLVRMINPSSDDVEALFKLRLVGFNNRRYDNHILYGRFLGYNNQQLFELSQKIIGGDRTAMFGEAYNLSYGDIYDFSNKKQSLKKFGVELGMHHIELDIPWDQPVPEELWNTVVDYCCNDVLLTEATCKERKGDFEARYILSELSGLPFNATTQNHAAKIIFEGDKDAKRSFVYTNLSKEFPGYAFDHGTSTFKGEITGEGGYVYAEPGMYENVAVLDVASMHPTSIEELNLFGEYTENFSQLKRARIAIKRGDTDALRHMFGGMLLDYMGDPAEAEALSYALKIVINSVYGLTSARFDSPFKDPRNKDNIVAKRGALFMIELKHAVQNAGYQVVHIKTDSIKIPNADKFIIEYVEAFGQNYGYEFELEATYDKFCLVNDAVYIARERDAWHAVGAQFQHPYVYKTLFTGEPVVMDDLFETKSVMQGVMYLDFEHDRPMALASGMTFIGKIGRFIPVRKDGGTLYRVKDDKTYAVTGTKGYLWLESKYAADIDPDNIDMSYFDNLVEAARKNIEKYGDYDEFVFTQPNKKELS